MMNQKINRNFGIDLLRCLSIFYIVGFWHLLSYTDAIPDYNNVVTFRITLIILGTFVFISGYLIGTKNIELKKQSLISFYFNRVLRIYPLFLLSIFIFTFYGLSDFKTSFKAALIISMFIKPAPLTLWFIAMLMLFYIITPFLMAVCERMEVKKIVVIYFILAFFLLLYWHLTGLLDMRILTYLPAYVLGLLVANNKISYVGKKKYLILALLLGVSISFLINTSSKELNFLFSTLMVTIFPFFLFTSLKNISITSKKIYNIIFILNYLSFCMYLFHRPIYKVLKEFYFPESNILQLIYLVAFCLPCIVLFSYIIQKTYDATMQALTTKFS